MTKLLKSIAILLSMLFLLGGTTKRPMINDNCDLLLYYKGNTKSNEISFDNIENNIDKYISYYDQIVKNKKVTKEIIINCIDKKVPLNLAFSVAKNESNFKIRAININYKDGEITSIDRGVFQLNNKSFPNLSEEDFFNYKINIKNGVGYLKYCLDSFSSQSEALSAYNGGHYRVQNNSLAYEKETYVYVLKIIDYSVQLEQGLE